MTLFFIFNKTRKSESEKLLLRISLRVELVSDDLPEKQVFRVFYKFFFRLDGCLGQSKGICSSAEFGGEICFVQEKVLVFSRENCLTLAFGLGDTWFY